MDNKIQLPLWETVKHSFLYVIKNINVFFKICSIFIVLWILEVVADTSSLCDLNSELCRTNIIDKVLTILSFLASAVIGANFIRYIILHQQTKWFHLHLGMYTLRFIGYIFFIAAMVILPTSLMLMITDNAINSNASLFIITLFHGAGLATLIGLTVLSYRLNLVYAAAAINDRKMTLAKSYMLTTGNMLKICLGQILLTLPTIITVVLCFLCYSLVAKNIVTRSIFTLLSMILTFFDAAIKASYYSHLYQYFTYIEAQQTEKKPEGKIKTVTKKAEPKKPETKKKTTSKKAEPKKKPAPKKKTTKK